MSQNIIGLNTPNNYRLLAVTISNQEGRQWDMLDLMDSFELNESIYSMFLTGSATFFDNVNIFNKINFTGQEYIRLHFSGPQKEEDDSDGSHINQVFRIISINSYIRDTQQDLAKTIYGVKFCSPLLYESITQRVNKHFGGKNGQIIDEITKKYLNFGDEPSEENTSKPLVKGGKELGNFFSVLDGDAGDVSGFLCPSWSVNKCLRYLARNTSDDTQMPYGDSYYLYQTANKGFRFCNVSTMQNMVYRLSEGESPEFMPRDAQEIHGDMDNPQTVGRDILNYNKMNMHNVIDGHKKGLFSGRILNYNTVTKQYTTIDNQFNQQFETNDKGEYTSKNTISDIPSFRMGEENVRIPADGDGEYGVPLPLANTGLQGLPITERFDACLSFDYNTPHTFSNVIEVDTDTSDSSISNCNPAVKFNRDRVEALFDQNSINVQLSGRTDISCGMMVGLNIPQPILEGGEVQETRQNEMMLIESIRWIGSKHGLECHLSCTTDGFSKDNYLHPDVTEEVHST